MYKWSKTSKRKLETCHEEIQLLFNEVLKIVDCTVVYGERTEQEQNELFHLGRSKLKFPKSNHNPKPPYDVSMAIDVIPYNKAIDSIWNKDTAQIFCGIVYTTWRRLLVEGKVSGDFQLRFGLNWSTTPFVPHIKEVNFVDGYHFELRDLNV